jgi:putative peptidoglycan lipid II flippase
VPVVAGLAAFQVNVLLDRLIAECLIPGDGAVGSLFLGNRLMQLPLAVFAIAIATAALPALSSCAAKKDRLAFDRTLRDAVVSILFWTVPAAVGLALLAEPIVALLFDRGSFLASRGALMKTSLVLIFYAPGLVAFGVAGLLARAAYARGESKLVMRAALWSVGVNLALNLVLVHVFQRVSLSPMVSGETASGEAGLALASTVAGFAYLSILSAGVGEGTGRDMAALLRWAGAVLVGVLVTALVLILPDAKALAWSLEDGWLRGFLEFMDTDTPRLPTAVCFGAFAALAVLICLADPGLRHAFFRTSATALGMGIFVNFILSSLPLEGDHWMIPVQRALAPVVLGAVAYWFLAGFIAAPEYERAREALLAAVFRRRGRKGGEDKGAEESKGS